MQGAQPLSADMHVTLQGQLLTLQASKDIEMCHKCSSRPAGRMCMLVGLLWYNEWLASEDAKAIAEDGIAISC